MLTNRNDLLSVLSIVLHTRKACVVHGSVLDLCVCLHVQVRLNGGTNIASAVAKAGSLLKADEATHSSNMRRVLVLLTGKASQTDTLINRLAVANPGVFTLPTLRDTAHVKACR